MGVALACQAVELGPERRLADGGVGVGGEAADGEDRQRLGAAVGVLDRGGDAGADVLVQAAPRGRAGDAQLGGQRLLGLGHLVIGAPGGLAQRPGVGGGRRARRDQRVEVERAQPGVEAACAARRCGPRPWSGATAAPGRPRRRCRC